VAFTLPISTTRHSTYLGEGRASHVPTVVPKMCAKTASTASSKVQPHLTHVPTTRRRSVYFRGYLTYRILSNSEQKLRKQGGTSFTPLTKVRLSLHRFPWHPEFFAALHEDSLYRQRPRLVQAGTLTTSRNAWLSASLNTRNS
jgi:hypothetical protein